MQCSTQCHFMIHNSSMTSSILHKFQSIVLPTSWLSIGASHISIGPLLAELLLLKANQVIATVLSDVIKERLLFSSLPYALEAAKTALATHYLPVSISVG